MDCRAVLIWLLIVQAACTPVKTRPQTGVLNATIKVIREEIGKALKELNESGLLPNTCISLNITELVGQEQQPLTADHLCCSRYYMVEMSKLTTEVSDHLLNASQYTQNMERLMGGSTKCQNCSIPNFEAEMQAYMHVRCVLERLDQRYSNAKF